jgi:nucleoside-diphosphate-sugar epimerase
MLAKENACAVVPRRMTLVTGVTGFVGRQLVKKLASEGHWLMLMVRGDTFSEARNRYIKLMASLTPLQSAKCLFFWGDLLHENVIRGNPQSRQVIENFCQRVIHCAASVSFGDDPEVMETNLKGTENLLRMMDRCQIKELHYVSTAYVCGYRPGDVVYEVHEIGVPSASKFRNKYEESKYLAERSVERWQYSEMPERSVTVYRPAVIVGDSSTGETLCFQGFYSLVRCAAFFRDAMKRESFIDKEFRIPLSGTEPVNLVPVDFVVSFIAECVTKPELHNNTYHVVPKEPFTSKQVMESLVTYFNLKGFRFVGPGDLTDISRIESMLMDYLGPYYSYLGTDSYFSTLQADKVMEWHPSHPEVLESLIHFAARTKFGRIPDVSRKENIPKVG